MIYLGPQKNLVHDQLLSKSNSYEVIVMQQHCGGENLILFKNYIKPNGLLTY